MSTLQLSASTIIPVADGKAEVAFLVIPDAAWDYGEDSDLTPADRAILAAQDDGWQSVGTNENFVDELDVSVITFWRQVQA